MSDAMRYDHAPKACITDAVCITHEVRITFRRNASLKKALAEASAFFWRRTRDLNPRAGYPTYSLSRGASSPLE